MHHQDKFLLRQFNHLNRNIQELKDKREIKEEKEVNKTVHNNSNITKTNFKFLDVHTMCCMTTIDDLHVRLTFNLGKTNQIFYYS